MRHTFWFAVIFFVVLLMPQYSFAQDRPNNAIGIHILFPEELTDAAKLINSNGGDWGYVIIPIQSGDKDRTKWQGFMDNAKTLHVIPIVRLATEGDYFNTKVWRKPNYLDVIDFANFLASLDWPTRTKYIVVGNEPNRADEWGGEVNPGEYAAILSYAAVIFHEQDANFFVISAGMDNAAATIPGVAMNGLTYLSLMSNAIPDVYSQIDGIGSHSYPNPAFAALPTIRSAMSVVTYRYENALIKSISGRDLPVFITETGWSEQKISDTTAADYYKNAFSDAWADPTIRAVTPFLLKAGGGPFQQFSLMNTDGSPTERYKTIMSLPKVKGEPELAEVKKVLGVHMPPTIPVRQFSPPEENNIARVEQTLKSFLTWIFKIQTGGNETY